MIDEVIMKHYLLGDLAEDARQKLEERLLTDDEFYQKLIALEEEAEDGLIDEYVTGTLSVSEREKFHQVFLLKPRRVEKLQLAQTLNSYANSRARATAVAAGPAASDLLPDTGRKPRWRALPPFLHSPHPMAGLALAALLLLMTSCAVWMFVRSRRLETELRQAQQQSQQSSAQPTPAQDLQDELAQARKQNDELSAALREAERQQAEVERRLAEAKAEELRLRNAGRPRTERPLPVIFSAVLSSIRRRGTEGEQPSDLYLPANATSVRLTLQADATLEGYRDFQAVVEKRGVGKISTQNIPAPKTQGGETTLTLTLPAKSLDEGDYLVTLSALSGGGQRRRVVAYAFRVIKR